MASACMMTPVAINASPFIRGAGPVRYPASKPARNAAKKASPVRAGGAAPQPSERPLWYPGNKAPEWLNGTLPGDFGFDPLGFGSDPAVLRWMVHAELVHARWAMLGVAGVLGQELVHATTGSIPHWYEAGSVTYFASTPTLIVVMHILFAFVELKRYFDIVNPGSQAQPGFAGLERLMLGTSPGYPGGLLFDPLGLGRATGIPGESKSVAEAKVKELKNGRLAMLAAVGLYVQYVTTGTGPYENLVAHLLDPGHANIFELGSQHLESLAPIYEYEELIIVEEVVI